jgi:hypothetical protein
MTVKRWFTPFFGTEVLMLLVLAGVVDAFTWSHSQEAFVLGYVMFGLLVLGAVAQLASIPWRKGLTRRERVLWWIASAIYGFYALLFIAASFT